MNLFFGQILFSGDSTAHDDIKNISKNIEKRATDLFEFFDIKKLSKKINITLWNDLEEYRLFTKNITQTTKVPAWLCGWVQNTNSESIIHTLTLSELRKCDTHRNNQIQDLENLIIHEIVHIAIKHIASNRKTKRWLTEALAISLSNQVHTARFSQSLENLYKDDFVDYGAFGLIGQYLIDKTSKEYIINLIKEPDFLINETKSIYEGVKAYHNNIK